MQKTSLERPKKLDAHAKPEYLAPTVVCWVPTSHKTRVERWFCELADCAGDERLACAVIPTLKQPQVVFVSAKEPHLVLRALEEQHAVARNVSDAFCCQAVARHASAAVQEAWASSMDGEGRGRVVAIRCAPASARPDLLCALHAVFRGGDDADDAGDADDDDDEALEVVVSAACVFNKWFVGIARANERNRRHLPLNAADDIVRDVGHAEAIVSRAFYKLYEVLHGYDQVVRSTMQYLMCESRADEPLNVLDIGASPGGWSTCAISCLPKHARVLAVDPGELAIPEHLPGAPRIVHCAKLLEAALEDGDVERHGPYALCVCDANLRFADVVDLMRGVYPFLADDCLVVLTAKHIYQGKLDRVMDAINALAGLGFGSLRLEYLFSNSRKERTVIGVKTQL